MLARERQNTIVEIVNREGSVRVKNLSKKFGVTEDSIRKDLAHLEKDGMLKKTYGGADRPVTVVTNMIDAILIMLYEKDTKTKLIFLGGKLNRGRDGFVGTITNRNISNYQFDKAFMGVVGIEVNRNRVYTYDTEDALTKKSVMEVSNECYMLMEREKLSKDGNYKYAGIDEFTGLIMEESVEGTIMSKLKSYNINIYC